MDKQVKKVCKHEPGKDWTDGCCTSNSLNHPSSTQPNEQVIESALLIDQART